MHVFLGRLNASPIGFSVLGFFVIGKSTVVTVCYSINRLKQVTLLFKPRSFVCFDVKKLKMS